VKPRSGPTPRSASRQGFDHLEDPTFEAFASLIEGACGVAFDAKKKQILLLHLKERALAASCESFEQYLELVSDPSNRKELAELCNSVLVHQTEFFRNQAQFDALGDVLRRLWEDRSRSRRPLTLWSAGCSSGEEPYSIAMVASEVFGPVTKERVRILATDLSPPIVERAKAGVYKEEAVESVPPVFRKYFLRTRPGYFQIHPDVAGLVSFRVHNLAVEPAPPEVRPGVDVIFCRNVTIYFSQRTLARVISGFEELLHPGGYLFLGHSESLLGLDHGFELVDLADTFAYRKPSKATEESEGRLVWLTKELGASIEGVAEVGEPPDSSMEVGIEAQSGEAPLFRRSAWEASRPRPGAPSRRPAPQEDGRLRSAHVKEIVAAAQGLLEKGEAEAALRLVDRHLVSFPTEAPLHFLRGSALHVEGREDDAVTAFSKAIYCDARFSLAYFYRGSVYESQGRPDLAARDFAAAARLLRQDPPGRWEPYLESMSHHQLVEVCEGKVRQLSSYEARNDARR
jgi:chemotaxis protein methyltransferase CheR